MEIYINSRLVHVCTTRKVYKNGFYVCVRPTCVLEIGSILEGYTEYSKRRDYKKRLQKVDEIG